MTREGGLQVVDTTAEGSLPGLEDAGRALGMQVIRHPLLRFAPATDHAPLTGALERLETYAAVAVTSPRASRVVAERLQSEGRRCRVPTWTAGGATSVPLAGVFTQVRVSAGQHGAAEAVAAAIIASGLRGPVLYLCGAERRQVLEQRLSGAGLRVDPVVCYRTLLAEPEDARLACAPADIVLVGSPSVARLLSAALSPPARPRLVALGPTTAREAADRGWPPAAVARLPTVPAVAQALGELAATLA